MIGEGISRTDGPLKVTGRAAYSAERRDMGPVLHGVVVGAAITNGRILRLDAREAEAVPGVRLVLSHHNAPRQGEPKPRSDLFDPNPQLTDDRVRYHGMPVAFVVAESAEAAQEAAALVEVEYEETFGPYALEANWDLNAWRDESRIGDLEGALRTAPAVVDEEYRTPYHFGQPIELNACVADWRDERLTVYATAQMVGDLQDALAKTLRLEHHQVVVDSAFVGGGFGSKIALHPEVVLASLAARMLHAAVRTVISRRQVFTLVGHRPASASRVRLAAGEDGHLTGLGHDALIQVTDTHRWKETVSAVARSLYAAPNRLTRLGEQVLELGPGEPVRGPGELPGLMVFEVAMDELAEKLGLDPVELRLRNDTAIDPENGRPLSGRRLADCLTEGARRFGWEDRPRTPASRREGNGLIGYGMASSIRGHFQNRSEARVRVEPTGTVLVQTDMTDLGTGTYTIAAQVAAAALGVPVADIRVELARSDLPRGAGSGGSWGSGNTSVAIDRACQQIRERVAEAAPGYTNLLAEVRRHFPGGIDATGTTLRSRDDPNYQAFSQYTYGASFAEVAVDADTAEVRLRRMLGVFACGRIINAKTARSQLIGGMIWGVSAALFEGAYVDRRNGAWVNGDLAEYLLPTHADIPDVEAIALDDFDEHANHLGIKGIGELGAGGTGGAVANAVYNATGVRIRDFPITIDKLLPGLMARD